MAVGKFGMNIMKLNYGTTGSEPGVFTWGYTVYDASLLANPLGSGGLARDATKVYSCMVISNAIGTVTQTIVMKFDAQTGVRHANIDLYTNTAVDCAAYVLTSASNMLVTVTLNTGTTELLNFDTTGNTLSLSSNIPRLRFVISGYKQLGSTRIFLNGPDIWMFYPSQSISAGTYSSVFITKFKDLVGMNWDEAVGCPSVH